MNTANLEKLMVSMEEAGLPQLLIAGHENIELITGIHLDPMERPFMLYIRRNDRPLLLYNIMFTPISDSTGLQVMMYSDSEDGPAMIGRLMDPGCACGIDRGLRADQLLDLIEMKAAASFVDASYLLDDIRACKSAEEAALMRESSAANDRAMERLIQACHEGMSEASLYTDLVSIYKDFSLAPDFGIIAFGANAADPHHVNDDTIVKPGDAVLMDIGATYKGWCSDMTRTVFWKEVSPEAEKIYDLVKAANEAAEAIIRPGIEFAEIDAAARKIISDAGYGPYFTHRLGHSIGRSTHEPGDVSGVNHKLTKPGMTFSIEPGIYLPGKVGVRIEDLVLVTEDGCEILNHYPKDLQVIG